MIKMIYVIKNTKVTYVIILICAIIFGRPWDDLTRQSGFLKQPLVTYLMSLQKNLSPLVGLKLINGCFHFIKTVLHFQSPTDTQEAA